MMHPHSWHASATHFVLCKTPPDDPQHTDPDTQMRTRGQQSGRHSGREGAPTTSQSGPRRGRRLCTNQRRGGRLRPARKAGAHTSTPRPSGNGVDGRRLPLHPRPPCDPHTRARAGRAPGVLPERPRSRPPSTRRHGGRPAPSQSSASPRRRPTPSSSRGTCRRGW